MPHPFPKGSWSRVAIWNAVSVFCTIAPKLKAACEHRAGTMGVFSPDPREQRLSRHNLLVLFRCKLGNFTRLVRTHSFFFLPSHISPSICHRGPSVTVAFQAPVKQMRSSCRFIQLRQRLFRISV